MPAAARPDGCLYYVHVPTISIFKSSGSRGRCSLWNTWRDSLHLTQARHLSVHTAGTRPHTWPYPLEQLGELAVYYFYILWHGIEGYMPVKEGPAHQFPGTQPAVISQDALSVAFPRCLLSDDNSLHRCQLAECAGLPTEHRVLDPHPCSVTDTKL